MFKLSINRATRLAIRSYSTTTRTPTAFRRSTSSTKSSVIPKTEESKEEATSTTPKYAFHDAPKDLIIDNSNSNQINWSDSFHGLGSQPFSKEICDVLLNEIDEKDVECKPDGLIYLPEIKYRRILNKAFGPGGWGLVPRTESYITNSQISREYGLICHGRLVSIARGEQDFFGGEEKITTALEGCKSNALMRCCKDLGIASELWDPTFIRSFKTRNCEEYFAQHATTGAKKKFWRLKSNKKIDYPWKEIKK
ncbi:unnamed protein product [Candida verbasci]|uniref:Mitochondrial genome maintenance protein MGM101 n=1 Tax=Candida verbasci TaxID=1227364 RepID=A0A9W4XAW1_9ASCO|nr:unnamed protein product [Candida verbasci]